MDRILKEERQYILSMCKQIKATGTELSERKKRRRRIKSFRWNYPFDCGNENENENVGCNVLLIQKYILRDAVSDLALHFLAKLGILAIKDIERDEIEFISKVWRIWRWRSKFFWISFREDDVKYVMVWSFLDNWSDSDRFDWGIHWTEVG
jgi:chaperonin GroEL (HSP60 family)